MSCECAPLYEVDRSFTAQNASTLMASEPNTIMHAMSPVLARPSALPNTPEMNAPASGNRMMSHSDCAMAWGGAGEVWKNWTIDCMGAPGRRVAAPSVLHGADFPDVDRAAASEHGDDDGEPDGRLRRRHGDDEEGRHVAHVVGALPREGHEGQVGGVQHQLD